MYTKLNIFRGLTKRQRFAVLTIFATLGLIATQIVTRVELHILFAAGLSVVVTVFAKLLFWPELKGIRKLTAGILIYFYTMAVAVFYFLLPIRWLTRLPTALLFGIGFYAILLTENIYNVATERSIQLLRAARSVGLLMSLITVFLLYDTVFSLRLNSWLNGALIALISAPLIYQNLWSMHLEVAPEWGNVRKALMLALVTGEVGFGLSFWPGNVTLQALFITSFFYMVTGLTQQQIAERLFAKTVREFLVVASVVFVLMWLTSSWGG